jgi:RNA recognition motif-containing protein
MSEIALGSQEQALLSPIVDSDPEVKLEVSESFAANNKRLYINNVSFYATEDDIEDLLKEFEV